MTSKHVQISIRTFVRPWHSLTTQLTITNKCPWPHDFVDQHKSCTSWYGYIMALHYHTFRLFTIPTGPDYSWPVPPSPNQRGQSYVQFWSHCHQPPPGPQQKKSLGSFNTTNSQKKSDISVTQVSEINITFTLRVLHNIAREQLTMNEDVCISDGLAN